MEFTRLLNDLHENFKTNKEFFTTLITKNPSMVFYKINELCRFVGSRYGLDVELHFPDSKKIGDVDSYGKENISIIINKFNKKFPLERDEIKAKASDIFSDDNPNILDAYMYEGKEGIKIVFSKNELTIPSRIEVLPGSFHLWIMIDDNVENFCNWLLSNVYSSRTKKF